MKLLILGVLLCTAYLSAYSSNISGTIQSSEEGVLPFASVLLFQSSDSTFIRGTVTDANGNFQFEHEGFEALFVRVQFVGYMDFISESFQANASIDLGTIMLIPDSKVLTEVVVSASKPLYEQRIDRMVVNVQNRVTNVGSNVLRVLSKSPSVIVDRATNQISLMGNQGVIVMINNKRVRMEDRDIMGLLESLSADNVESIEIITTPPAGYDIQGNAGIININTIQSQTDGFTGRFNAFTGYGWSGKYGGSANLSYSHKKIYLYGNLSVNNDHSYENRKNYSDFLYGNRQVINRSFAERIPFIGFYMGELGFDYDISKTTSIGVNYQLQFRDWRMDSDTKTEMVEGNESVVQRVVSREVNQLKQSISNIHLKHRFSDKTMLMLDYDYISFKRENPSTYYTTKFDGDNIIDHGEFISSGKTPLSIHVAKADVQFSIKEGLSIETGLKATISAFKNQVRVAHRMEEGYIDDEKFTDVFSMDEKIYASYISMDWKVNNKLKLKSGLRYEYYDLYLSSEKQNTILSRSRGNLFPTVHLNYALGEEKDVTLSYARRVDRPGFLILAPAFYFFDQNMLLTGNPNIVPTLSSQYKMDVNLKAMLLSFQYTGIKKPVYNWHPALDEESTLFIIKPLQGSHENTSSVSASIPWQITKNWNSQFNITGFYKEQNPIVEGQVLQVNTTYLTFTTTHTYNLTNYLTLELTGIYNSPYRYGVMQAAARPGIDVGIQKKFSSGTTLSFNVADVFNSYSQWDIASSIPETSMYFRWVNNNEGPIFRISLSMPLGNKKVKAREKIDTGSTEEQGRLR